MDQTCPGIIQNSLNGREDFNEYAFDIAFAGKIPDEPYPIDPITMIEAIQIRIDHEREEIRKKCPFYDTYRRRRSDLDTVSETSNDEGKKPKQKYYSSQKSQRGASSDKSKHVSSSQKGLPFSADYDNIDRHFCSKNISEVNNGVLAFLKAEQSYGSTPHAHVCIPYNYRYDLYTNVYVCISLRTIPIFRPISIHMSRTSLACPSR